ncbi:MAG: hypothetical protein CSA52_03420 [Gammaproteobacteria bacterium]|nr:MAG: hypothetical protein CSB48_04150 [Pseudomonadota bacterium]PIE38243.1 MAG: hypothetical protein CSA52_03420 [Gammaproteobacteria bacterium]
MNTENGNIDLDSVFPKGSKVSIDESDRLTLAKQVLCWLALICIGVFVFYGIYPENKALSSIFELIKIGALPLVTLVISFYFPNSNN